MSQRPRPHAERTPRGIKKDGPGRWLIRSQVVCRRTGRRVERRRRVEGALEDAVQAKAELDRAIREGTAEQEAAGRLSVLDCAIRWQETKAAEGLAASTIRGRADVLVDHVLPFLGSYEVAQLTPGDLLDWRRWAMARRAPKGGRYAAVTVNGWWRILKAMLRSAYAELQLSPCPADAVRPLREVPVDDEDEDRTLAAREVVATLQALRRLRPDVYPLALTGFATGCRHCELSAAKWDDVDWDRGRLRIRRSHVKGIVQERTKTRRSRRAVVLLPAVLEVLRAHRRDLVRRQAPGLEEGWAFPSAADTSFSTATVADALKRAARAAGIERVVSTKTFRRTWNTLAVLQRVDRALIQANTGHTTDAMTTHYARFRYEHLAEVQQRVVGFLREVEGHEP